MLPTKTPKTKSPKNLDGVIDATKKTKFTFQVRKKRAWEVPFLRSFILK